MKEGGEGEGVAENKGKRVGERKKGREIERGERRERMERGEREKEVREGRGLMGERRKKGRER